MNTIKQHDINIIKKKAEIKKILNTGKKIFTRFGTFFLLKDQNKEKFSFAVLVKKNIGNAVQRNYKKRIVKEFIRKNKLKFNNYNNIIFIFLSEQKINYNELQYEFINSLKNI